MRLSAEDLAAADAAPADAVAALRVAAERIERFHRRQLPQAIDYTDEAGVRLGLRWTPIASVGLYVPGGTASYPSSVLMNAIPARVAGVERLVMTVPAPDGALNPLVLAAARLAGIDEIYRVGGAQAVAALAYGTATLAPVDKIVGPGNAWVTAAKKLVSFDCAIDMLAGPTEIVVTSDGGDAAGIAADLVAQAEHDPQAVAIFITSRAELAKTVAAETKLRAKSNKIAREALTRNGIVLVTKSAEEAQDLTNRIAPEHLTVDSAADIAWVRNAGSVFIGRWSAQPLGDYVSGPNHTLPTSGLARVRGGLSVLDFVKLVTVQEYSKEGVQRLGPAAIRLANAEGLAGHAEAIRARGAHA